MKRFEKDYGYLSSVVGGGTCADLSDDAVSRRILSGMASLVRLRNDLSDGEQDMLIDFQTAMTREDIRTRHDGIMDALFKHSAHSGSIRHDAYAYDLAFIPLAMRSLQKLVEDGFSGSSINLSKMICDGAEFLGSIASPQSEPCPQYILIDYMSARYDPTHAFARLIDGAYHGALHSDESKAVYGKSLLVLYCIIINGFFGEVQKSNSEGTPQISAEFVGNLIDFVAGDGKSTYEQYFYSLSCMNSYPRKSWDRLCFDMSFNTPASVNALLRAIDFVKTLDGRMNSDRNVFHTTLITEIPSRQKLALLLSDDEELARANALPADFILESLL